MTNFPGRQIQYSETIPGVQPMPRANLDVATGGEQIGKAWAKFGTDLFAIGEKIQKANDVVELSTLKRQYDETMSAAYITYSTTADENARAMVLQKAITDVESLQSRRQNVKNAFNVHLNNTIGNWQKTFITKDLSIKKQNVKDQAMVNIQSAMEKGDLVEAAKEWNYLKTFFPEMQAEADNKIKNLPSDSALAQARIMIGANQPQQAIALLEGLKGLSGEQLDYRDKLLRIARQTQIQLGDEFGKSILKEILDADRKIMTPSEKSVLALDLRNKVIDPNNGLSLAESKAMLSYIDQWEKGQDVATDYDVYRELQKRALSPDSYGGVSQIETDILNAKNKISRADTEELLDTVRRTFESSQAKAIDEAVDFAKGQLVDYKEPMDLMSILERLDEAGKEKVINERKLQLYNHAEYNRALSQWIKKNPEATSDDIYIESRRLLVHYRKPEKQLREEIESRESMLKNVKPRKKNETIAEYLKRTR